MLEPGGATTDKVGLVILLYAAIGFVVVVGFVWASSRQYGSQWESQRPAEDMRRADQYDPTPPDDDTGGWV